MFIPVQQLNLYNPEEQREVTERWETPDGRRHYEFIMARINAGAGEDFLQWDLENGELKGFLRDMWDLRGFSLFKAVDFANPLYFEAMDFSYAQFYHSTFRNAYLQGKFAFAKFYNCTFKDCTFQYAVWNGCTFERCTFESTDFIEQCRFVNCDFSQTRFKRFFTPSDLFEDCRFDVTVELDDPAATPIAVNGPKIHFDNKQLGQFYLSIQDAFASGAVYDRRREYYYKSRQARTRYNNQGFWDYAYKKFLIEFLTGYGIRPFNTLLAGVIIIAVFATIFYIALNSVTQAVLSSISAFLTMGDASSLPWPLGILYLAEGFLGIFIFGLYLTTLANVWFSER